MDEQSLAEMRKRLDRLENAHRALAAQHLALQITCRSMLPFIPENSAEVGQVAVRAYDICNAHMDEHAFDDEYQADVRSWLDQFFEEILAGARIREGRG